jgi:rubrerythrin
MKELPHGVRIVPRENLPVLYCPAMADDCQGELHPKAVEGIHLFNSGRYFEAHEALEEAWRAEAGPVRELYRGILQVAVAYYHILRENYAGAVKVYGRSMKWLKDWPEVCRGIRLENLRLDAGRVMAEVRRLGQDKISRFERSLLKSIELDQVNDFNKHIHICDRCGHEMVEKNCKVTCPNCGNRFDCSDLNIHFD